MVNTDKFLKPKLPEGKENKKEVKNMCWNGEPGKEGAVIVGRKEIVKNMARLSLTGNSERAISLYRAWSFLIPHYGPYTIKQPEVLLPQILESALVNRYGHSWERVISIASKVLGMKPDTIRNQMERGMLQIGIISPAKHKRGKRGYRNTYISPKLFYELTGYVWKGEEDA